MADRYVDLTHEAADIDQAIESIASHVNDSTSHVTSAERESWNGKADAADVLSLQTAVEANTNNLTSEAEARQSADSGIKSVLARQIDSGAKNLMKLTGEDVTGYGISCVFDAAAGTITLDGVNADKKCTGTFNVQVADPLNMPLEEGKSYHFLCEGTSNDTYGIYIYKSGAIPMSQWDCFDHTDADWNPAWSTSNGFRLFIRNGTVVDHVVLKPMICTADDWSISEDFQPYCPTMQELYRMIIAMQS